MRKFLEIGGLVAAVVLIAFGIGAVVIGAQGRSTVHSNLKAEQIVGTPDMTPAAIKGEAAKAGLKNVTLPTCTIANQAVTTGSQARCFAQYMRIHTLEATDGLTYSQMPRYAATDGKGTNDATQAVQVNGQPQDNPKRNIWVNETALTTALNASYMAEQTALFGIVVGIALLITGVGLGVLALGGTLRNADPALKFSRRREPKATEAIPAA